AQPVMRLQLPSELTAATLGEERVFAVQLHARLIGVGLLALLVDAHVACRHALERLAFEKQLRSGEAGKNLDTQRLCLLAEPPRDVAQADDVVAVVLEARR